MAQVGVGGHGLALSEAAIRKLRTTAGNVESAEFRAANGRMNVETQRGANELHGQGFLFDRQNVWGAQNPFARWVQNTGTITSPVFTALPYTPPDRETVWGIGLGSRIRRNKLFWFAALDGFNRNDPGVSTVRNPDVFFAPQKDAVMQVLSSRMGVTEAQATATYTNMLETLDGLLGPAPRTSTQWTGFGRLDWQAVRTSSLYLGRDRRTMELARRRADPRFGYVWKPQFRLDRSQRKVAGGSLGGIPYPQPDGRDQGFSRKRHTGIAPFDSFRF